MILQQGSLPFTLHKFTNLAHHFHAQQRCLEFLCCHSPTLHFCHNTKATRCSPAAIHKKMGQLVLLAGYPAVERRQ
jgi:hypothetical protein